METLEGLADVGRPVGSMEKATNTYLQAIMPEDGLAPEQELLAVSLLSSARAIDTLVAKGRDISRMIGAFNETFTLLKEQEGTPTGNLSQEQAEFLMKAMK